MGIHTRWPPNSAITPRHVIEGVDSNYRSLTVGKILLEGLQNALKLPKGKASGMNPAPLPTAVDQMSLLNSLDMTLRLDKDDYEEQLITEQARFSGLMRDKRMRKAKCARTWTT